MKDLSLLTWNVANPSAERAERQLSWLTTRPEQIFVLTETKASAGCKLLADAFRSGGYEVVESDPNPGEFGTMIVSRLSVEPDEWAKQLSYLASRACSALLPTSVGRIHLIGLYVPSRDASPEKKRRKLDWLNSCQKGLDALQDKHFGTIFLGDLNILEPGHHPHYPFFAQFEYDFYEALTSNYGLIDAFRHLNPELLEYSWVGRTGDGYRYDHVFCSESLCDVLTACEYLHEPRESRLSDHSAVKAIFRIEPASSRAVSDPVAVLHPPMLF